VNLVPERRCQSIPCRPASVGSCRHANRELEVGAGRDRCTPIPFLSPQNTTKKPSFPPRIMLEEPFLFPFFGQELLASLGDEVYCWLRPQKSSSAEVDFVVAASGRVIPIEAKSGPPGRLRSLHLLLAEYPQCAPGLVLSEAPYAELPEQGLIFVPLYYAGTLFDWTAGGRRLRSDEIHRDGEDCPELIDVRRPGAA
jgi:hypothetical protein